MSDAALPRCGCNHPDYEVIGSTIKWGFGGLRHGLYILNWRDGGSSLASVGSDSAGNRWYAPTNWIEVPGFDWHKIESVTPVKLS